jgi:protein gp37
MAKKKPEETPLNVAVKNGVLRIEIGVSTLAFGALHSQYVYDMMPERHRHSREAVEIAAVFGVMAAAPQHTFQVLTKRAKRMREWFEWIDHEGDGNPLAVLHVEAGPHIADAIGDDSSAEDHAEAACEVLLDSAWPLPNVWLGVSVENQDAADERIPELLRTPAALRFISAEPLLGSLHLTPYIVDELYRIGRATRVEVDWVIAGGESGPGARPCEVDWLRSLRDQCKEAGTTFFLKQAFQRGSEAVGGPIITAGPGSKRKPGGIIELPYLDGVQHLAFPEVTRG